MIKFFTSEMTGAPQWTSDGGLSRYNVIRACMGDGFGEASISLVEGNEILFVDDYIIEPNFIYDIYDQDGVIRRSRFKQLTSKRLQILDFIVKPTEFTLVKIKAAGHGVITQIDDNTFEIPQRYDDESYIRVSKTEMSFMVGGTGRSGIDAPATSKLKSWSGAFDVDTMIFCCPRSNTEINVDTYITTGGGGFHHNYAWTIQPAGSARYDPGNIQNAIFAQNIGGYATTLVTSENKLSKNNSILPVVVNSDDLPIPNVFFAKSPLLIDNDQLNITRMLNVGESVYWIAAGYWVNGNTPPLGLLVKIR